MFRENKQNSVSEDDVSEKYKKMSSRFAVLKWISLIILVTYVLISVSINGDKLSFDSIRYIAKYMKDDPLSLVSDGDTFVFDYESANNAYIIGTDFAIIGKEMVTIYDFSGEILFSDKCPYNNPIAVAHDNELIVYEIGGKELRFYNSYSLTERMSFESPIFDVSVAENGNFLVMTASDGYRSGFRIYNKQKSLIFRCNFGEHSLQSTAISEDGNNSVAVSAVIKDNKVSTVLNIYSIPNKEPVHTETIDGEYPVSSYFIGESVVLLTDKKIRFFNNNFESVSSISYDDEEPLQYRICDDKIVITYGVSILSQDTKIKIFNSEGKNLRELIVGCSVSDIDIVGDFVHVLCGESIETYSLEDGSLIKKTELDKIYNSSQKITEDKFLLMRPDGVRLFIFQLWQRIYLKYKL